MHLNNVPLCTQVYQFFNEAEQQKILAKNEVLKFHLLLEDACF